MGRYQQQNRGSKSKPKPNREENYRPKPPPKPRPVPNQKSMYEPAEADVAYTLIEYMEHEDGRMLHRHVIITHWRELESSSDPDEGERD